MKLLFVCSGNICRSPMAERLALHVGDLIGLPVEARSAGTLGLVDRPADGKAVAVCREVGIDLSDHRSRALSADLVRWADHVLVMDLGHAEHLREFFPMAGDKVLQLGPFGGLREIRDPLGGWTWNYRRTRRQLDTAVRSFLVRAAR